MKNMTAGQDWFHKGVGIASADDNEDGLFDYQLSRSIRTQLLNYHYTSIGELYDGSQGGQDAPGDPTPAMLSSVVNDGVSIINYTGHGDTESWHTGDFHISDVNALVNDNKSPKRAQEEFNLLLTSDSYFTFGALCYNASIKMISPYINGFRNFRYWNIFGDPSVTVIPHKPCTFSVTGTINSDKTYRACYINVSNATITNNANVVFDATEETTIYGPFEVQSGSTLEIK